MSHLPAGKISNISATLFDQPTDEWQMTEAERCTLAMMLQRIQPVVAIEIGTAQGGSLAVLARHTRHVYSLDIGSTCQARLGHWFSNVTFISGSFRETLPALLAGLQAGNQQLGFILINGDHSRAGVRQDINNILGFRPVSHCILLCTTASTRSAGLVFWKPPGIARIYTMLRSILYRALSVVKGNFIVRCGMVLQRP